MHLDGTANRAWTLFGVNLVLLYSYYLTLLINTAKT